MFVSKLFLVFSYFFSVLLLIIIPQSSDWLATFYLQLLQAFLSIAV